MQEPKGMAGHNSALVTVIIPAYNSARTIAATLASVQAQHYSHWQCFIVDDGSVDNTAEVVQSFLTDQRFYYFQQANEGVSAARNKALRMVTEGYIQFLDADDVIAPGKLQSHVAFLESHPEIDVVYSDFVRFTDEVDFTAVPSQPDAHQISGGGQPVLRQFIRGNFVRINTALFRHEVLQSVHRFNPKFRHVEDWDFWFRMTAAGKHFYFLPEPKALAGVRTTEGSLSSDLKSMQLNYLMVLQSAFQTMNLNGRNRIELMLRFELALLDKLILRKGRIRLLRNPSTGFLLTLFLCGLLLLPFYLVYKPIQLLRNRK